MPARSQAPQQRPETGSATRSAEPRTTSDGEVESEAQHAARQPAHAVDSGETGVFLFLNGVLCRTADSRGRFRPADVFAGLDREAETVTPATPRPTSHDDGDGEQHVRRDAVDETVHAVDSDCPIFNALGVMSGGVVLDPVSEVFVDCSDDAVVTVAGVTAAAPPSAAPDAATAALRRSNECAYRVGDTARIRPECPLVLCCAALPLPPPLPDGAATPAPAVASTSVVPTVRSRMHATITAASSVQDWLTRMAPSSPQRRSTWVETWKMAEEFRLSVRADRDIRAATPASFLPPELRFTPQHRGQPVALDAEQTGDEDGSAATDAWHDITDTRASSSLAAVPPAGVRCAAASFSCFSGAPFFALPMTGPQREEPQYAMSPKAAMHRIPKRLRPYAGGEAALRRPRTDDADATALLLQPFRLSHPRSVAFSLFYSYLHYLGVRRNGVRLTGETPATSMPRHVDRATDRWDLCPPGEYDVAAEVDRRRQQVAELHARTRGTASGGILRASTSPGDIGVAADAWTAINLSQRSAVLQRLSDLDAYLHLLRHETNRPSATQ